MKNIHFNKIKLIKLLAVLSIITMMAQQLMVYSSYVFATEKHTDGMIEQTTQSNEKIVQTNEINNVEDNKTMDSQVVNKSPDLYSIVSDLKVGEYNLHITALKGVFPEGTTVEVKEIPSERNNKIEDIIENKIDDEQSIQKVVSFDFSFKDLTGKYIEPYNGAVNIAVEYTDDIKEIMDDSISPDIKVFHVDDSNNAETIVSNKSEEDLTFEAVKFSEYSLVITDGVVGGKCGDNLEWKITPQDKMLIISGTGAMDSVPWSAYKKGIKKLKIEEGITSIYESAFVLCVNLEGELSLPSSLVEINDYAFYGCSKITGDLIIPDNVEKIGVSAFRDCDGLDGVIKLPSNLQVIGNYAFQGCTNLKGSLNFSKNLKQIGNSAFVNCKSISGDINIPDSGVLVDAAIFYGCNGLDGSVIIPENIKTPNYSIKDIIQDCSNIKKVVNDSDFSIELPQLNGDTWISIDNSGIVISNIVKGTAIRKSLSSNIEANDISGTCGDNIQWKLSTNGVLEINGSGVMKSVEWENYKKGVKEIIISEGITELVDKAFEGCANAEKVYLPSTLIKINDYAFNQCSSLSGKLSIPENVNYIGTYAFGSCKGFIGDLIIHDNVTTMNGGAFYGCSGLNGRLVISKSIDIIRTCTFEGCENLIGELVLNENIIEIGGNAFKDCKNLMGELKLPKYVTSIGYGAFKGCSGFIGELNLPDKLIDIGEQAFWGCVGLNGDIIIPDSTKTLGNYAFKDCIGLNGKIVIPATCTVLYQGVHVEASVHSIIDGCINIKKVINNSSSSIELPVLEDDAWVSIDNSAYVINEISEGIAIRKSDSNNASHKLLNGTCGEHVTWQLDEDGLLSISGSGAIEEISWKKYKENIKQLHIESGITVIPEYAFKDCVNLKGNLKLPDSLTEIGECAFFGCTGITGDLVIPDNTISIGQRAFLNCSGLNGTIKLPEGLQKIGWWAFGNCSNVTGILVIPKSVTYLDSLIIDGCNSLKKVINNSDKRCSLPDSDEYIWTDINNTQYEITAVSGGSTAVRVCNVKFVSNGKTIQEQNVIVDEKVVSPSVSGNKNKKLIGWYIDEENKIAYDFNEPVTKNMTLYALWKDIYSITYIVNGKLEFVQEVVADDKTFTPPALEKEGYKLDGWYTDNVFRNKYSFGTLGISKSMKLYARWIKDINTDISDKDDSNNSSPSEPDRNESDNDSEWNVGNIIQVSKNIKIDGNKQDDLKKAVVNCKENSVITVDMTSNKIVEADVFKLAKGKNISLVFNMNDYKWTVNGLDITGDKFQDVDLTVIFGQQNIPVDKVAEVAGENAFVNISLKHNGEFGFAAYLEFSVTNGYAGRYMNLYHYYDNQLDYKNSGLINDNGNVKLMFTHASEYVGIISNSKPEGILNIVESPKTADTFNIIPLVFIMACAVMVFFGASASKNDYK